MARPRKASKTLTTREEAVAAARALLETRIELEKQEGALDLARAAATRAFEKPIDERTKRIQDLELQLQTWFAVNTPTDRKSVDLFYATIGTRLGNKVLAPLNRSWTWEAICIKLREAWGNKYFHKLPEAKPDKDRIKEALNDEQLKDIGLKVGQEDNFFIELDRTKLGEAAK